MCGLIHAHRQDFHPGTVLCNGYCAQNHSLLGQDPPSFQVWTSLFPHRYYESSFSLDQHFWNKITASCLIMTALDPTSQSLTQILKMALIGPGVTTALCPWSFGLPPASSELVWLWSSLLGPANFLSKPQLARAPTWPKKT